MQSPKCSSNNSEPCCERNAEEATNNSSKNLRNSSTPSIHRLTIDTNNIAIQDSNGSSPTTPPSPLYKKNLSIDTNVAPSSSSSSSNENPTPSVEETTPSPTTANVRHNVLQKISKWSGLDNFGTPLEPTHIIPLKTPIKTKFLESARKWRPFTTEDFLFGNLKSGYCVAGIVDLSNHDCIYDVDSVCSPKNPQQFLNEIGKLYFKDEAEKDMLLKYVITSPVLRKSSIYDSFTSDEIRNVIDNTETIPLTYIKVRLVAKEIPGVEQQVDFNHVINDFFERFPSHYIGVHCSYGFNRTGFICCSYLISERAIPIDEALNIFAKSKPPGIKHNWFLKALRKRYDPNYIEPNDENEASEDTSM